MTIAIVWFGNYIFGDFVGIVGSHYLYKYFKLFKQIQPTCTEGVNAYLYTSIFNLWLTSSLIITTFSVMMINSYVCYMCVYHVYTPR